MADQPNTTDAPSTPRIFSATSEELENINFEREEKIRQLQWELKDLSERMHEIERKQSQPVYPYPTVRVESAPPGCSMQTPMLVPWGTVPPQWQPPSYFLYQNQIPGIQQPLAKAKERCTTKKERSKEKIDSQKHPMDLIIPKKKKTCKNSGKGRWTQSGSECGQKAKWCSMCRAYHFGSCSELTRRCCRCGIVGHEAQYCSFKTDVCWHCQKEGHRSGQCPSNSRCGSRFGQRSMWCTTCKTAHTGTCSEQTRRCRRCGIVGHEVQSCSYRIDVCWNCQMEGHRSGQCMSTRSYGSRQGASGGSVSAVAGSSAAASGQKRKNPPPHEGRTFQR